MKHDWVEEFPDGKEYGATFLGDGVVRCDFPPLGTYWDVRFFVCPAGGKAAIFPKGRGKAVCVLPVDKGSMAYIMTCGDDYKHKAARIGLELVCGWLRKYTLDFTGYAE